MKNQYLKAGLIMQAGQFLLVACIAIVYYLSLVNWSFKLITTIIVASALVLFNLTSIIMIAVGATTSKEKGKHEDY